MSAPDRPDISRLLDRAGRVFRDHFGTTPTHAAAAPGRVNLIGEHVDYTGGLVLPIAIDRCAVVVGARDERPGLRLVAADLDESADLPDPTGLEPIPATPGWASRLGHVAREAAGARVACPGLRLVLASAVPIGAGLSSSAAVEVATVTLLGMLVGAGLDPDATAALCRRAEHAATGVPCGIMDMLVSARAIADHAMLIDCRTLETTPVPLPPQDDAAILVADTGSRRQLAGTAYGERRATCERVATRLGLATLRDARPVDLERDDLTPVERRRAMHVVAENARTAAASDRLRAGDLDAFGRLMFESHDSLRDLYEVSCPELDAVVAAARRRRDDGGGVYGARMTGAGFGGCVIALARRADVAGTIAALADALPSAGEDASGVFEVRAAGGAAGWRWGSGNAVSS